MRVYSYHTFILPFVWEGTDEHRRTMEEFAGCFRDNPNWVCTDMPDEYYIRRSPALVNNADVTLLYKEYQYFHPFVRKAIYGFGENIVTNFSFMPDKIRNKGHYYITKNGHTYDLTVNGIKLKIFNTGVALFIMECENRGKDADGNPQNDFASVKNINNYGRRISLPFIPDADQPDISLCADRLCVETEGIFRFEDDYRAFIERVHTGGELYEKISLTHMCGFIKDILGFGSLRHFTSKRRNEEHGDFYIYPALDDRMFVCCLMADKAVTRETLLLRDGEYAYQRDEAASKSLYEFIFVDPDGKCSCPTRSTRLDLLKSHIYDRWLGDGDQYISIVTMTAQNMMMLADSAPDFLIDNFLTQYIQMSSLTLAQRATLIHFQREASNLSEKVEKTGRSMNRVTIMKLMNLQERFVAYRSQLHFTEVTPQEQGIEMYDMMRGLMFIERETESLDKHLESLNEAAETNLDFGFNRIALIFTWISCILAVMQNAMCFFTVDGDAAKGFSYVRGNVSLTVISLTITSLLVALLVILYRYRRRK